MILKKIIPLFIVLTFSITAEEIPHAERIDVSDLKEEWVSLITLEHATKRNQLRWGLMGKKSLEKDHGMTFNFDHSGQLNFWMFNCLIDLAVAFVDHDHIIREIHKMKAYPERMDPHRPVKSVKDLKLYPPYDPAIEFFKKKSIRSEIISSLALEMESGWFAEHDTHPGDVAIWHTFSKHGFICHTLDISDYKPTEETAIILTFPGDLPHAVWLPNDTEGRDVAFYTEFYKPPVLKATLEGGADLPLKEKKVLFSGRPVKYALIAKKGTMNKQKIQKRSIVEK